MVKKFISEKTDVLAFLLKLCWVQWYSWKERG